MESLIKHYNSLKQIIFRIFKRIVGQSILYKVSGAVFNMVDQNQEHKSDSPDLYEAADNFNYVLYRDRPEWKDVQPIAQDDGPARVVQIAYSTKFSDVYDYFRAVLKSGEKSLRALSLVTDAITLNPANYTVWIYRLEIVKHLKVDLNNELEYISNVIREFTKNYQVWQYRKTIVEMLNDPSGELEFTADILDMDSKNYHAWQYRQWVLTTFSELMQYELNFVDNLISQDMRNNSAWNQRYFVINNSDPDSDVINKELEYTFGKIRILSKNESAWNYLRGLLLYSENGVLEDKVRDFCSNLYNKGNRSVHLMSCLIDLTDADDSTDPENVEKIKFALKLCFDLASDYDPIRRYYWAYISKDIELKFNFKEHDTKIVIENNRMN
ncbi:protein farnesyltransferase/geranylgeranyltransferase type-1 subunit alpha [Aphis craccivora]|uniref:Protein farnesyltransferase/geranylgeranyltransferase type-1 subunit alpha n=1 Tax=Aphis craccivora TaxID=307492 RepID=A0A6G0YQI5_APHCR|nr:protein farnesyltransferase/geranylgeranyltransferase type-1 subunit alpha [Aphis craccivora]